MDYVSIIIGLVVGGIAGWLIANALSKARIAESSGKFAAREQEIKQLNERIAQMNARIDELNAANKAETERRAAAEEKASRVAELENANDKLQKEAGNLREQLATLNITLKKEQEAAEKQLKLIEEARTNLADSFKALSSQALNTNNEAFLKLAKQTLETYQVQAKGELSEREKAIQTLVQPLKDTLERYEKQVRELETTRQDAYSGLTQQVKSLIDTEQSLKKETGKLVTALSAPQVRGHWGEITLRRVAELAGMSDRCDFVEQESIDSPTGRLRPDMIIDLPNGRRIVVDAKAPLKAYLEAIEATTDEGRRAKSIEHARQVKTRVQELCKKEYWDQFPEAPEFVVLFLPGEQFLGAALQEDPDLLEDAFARKVILATPTTLIALLKAIAYGWRQEALTENAQEISELGKQLYERIAKLAEHFEDLGRSLDRSVQAYNKAVGSLESRVMVTARKFKELGATGKEELPEIQPIEHATRQMLPIGFEVEESASDPEARNQA